MKTNHLAAYLVTLESIVGRIRLYPFDVDMAADVASLVFIFDVKVASSQWSLSSDNSFDLETIREWARQVILLN